MVTVIYFAINSGLEMISIDHLIFIQSLIYSFSMLPILIATLLVLRAQFMQSYFDFYSLGISDQKYINCAFTLHSSLFYTVHLPTTLNLNFLLLHDFIYPGRWNMPSNNKEHHQQKNLRLRYELKKWIVSAHRMSLENCSLAKKMFYICI